MRVGALQSVRITVFIEAPPRGILLRRQDKARPNIELKIAYNHGSRDARNGGR